MMAWVGGYVLDLYCDHPEHDAPGTVSLDAEFCSNERGGVARQKARRAGWIIEMRTGRAICPTCRKRDAVRGG